MSVIKTKSLQTITAQGKIRVVHEKTTLNECSTFICNPLCAGISLCETTMLITPVLKQCYILFENIFYNLFFGWLFYSVVIQIAASGIVGQCTMSVALPLCLVLCRATTSCPLNSCICGSVSGISEVASPLHAPL